MGKAKRKKRADIAVRHGFDSGGLLGHESTYSVNVSEHVALAVDTVFACVRILADLTSDADVGEYRGTMRLDTLSRLARRPMGSITRRTWIWQLTSTMALYNGAYLWSRLGKDAEGVPISVEVVAPSRVTWTSARTVHVDGSPAQPDDLTWVPRMTFPTLTRELSTLIRLAREAIAAAWSADSYRSDFWQSGGPPSWYIKSDQPLSNTEAETISDRIVTRRTEAPGRPLVLGKGAEPKSLQVGSIRQRCRGGYGKARNRHRPLLRSAVLACQCAARGR